MPKTGYLKGHKEYAGAYKGQKKPGAGPKTVTNKGVPMKKPKFKPLGKQPTKGKLPKVMNNPKGSY